MAYEAGTTQVESHVSDSPPPDYETQPLQMPAATARSTGRAGALPFIVALAIPLAVGLISSALTGDAMGSFGRLSQPPLSPPAWLFPVAWTILYVLMGASSYLIYAYRGEARGTRRIALVVYGLQLAFNFAWSLLFFRGEFYYFAFVWLLAMWALIIALMALAVRISRPAAALLAPYLAWTTFAAYLNLSIALLN